MNCAGAPQMTRCLLTEDYDKTRYEVETPLTSRIDYARVRKELDIPDYVDPKKFLIERGLVTIWAAQKPSRLKEFGNSPQLDKIKDESIPVLLFGGGAVKILSKAANDPKSPLCRELGDIDLVASKKRGQDLYKLLLTLSEVIGTRYYHFTTLTDQRFNAMMVGKRYRVRAIDKILGKDEVKSGTLDILIDGIDLRHKVDVRDAFDDPKNHLYTIGSANLVLAKCQYILDAPKNTYDDLVQYKLEYRILHYPYYKSDKILIGIEEKDMKDVCAILLDHDVGEAQGMVNTSVIRKVLERDKKFALTFRLNIESLLRNEKLLKEMGLADSNIERIFSRANKVLDAIPPNEKKWSNPWWNEDVETPHIFGKAK
jgi:hypothetical protein